MSTLVHIHRCSRGMYSRLGSVAELGCGDLLPVRKRGMSVVEVNGVEDRWLSGGMRWGRVLPGRPW